MPTYSSIYSLIFYLFTYLYICLIFISLFVIHLFLLYFTCWFRRLCAYSSSCSFIYLFVCLSVCLLVLAGAVCGQLESRGVSFVVSVLIPPFLHSFIRLSVCLFWQALSAGDLSLVVYACSRVDPTELFGTRQLSPPVLLSLIQQLSCDLTSDTTIKVKWVLPLPRRQPKALYHGPRRGRG